jgi:hypothetical protein
VVTWLREGKEPPQKVLDLIVGYLHRVARPVYLGTLSLHIGYSLAQTEAFLIVLEERGIVRPMTIAEKTNHRFREDDNVFRLVDDPDPAKGKW